MGVSSVADQLAVPEFVLPESPIELAALHDAITRKLTEAPLTSVSDDELLCIAETLERSHRRSVGADAHVFTEISDRAAFRKVGCLSPATFLDQHLRLGQGERKRRWTAALAIAPLHNLQGEPLEPKFPATAIAVADGDLSLDHVSEIAAMIDDIPRAIPAETVALAEAQMATAGRDLTPEALRTVGRRILAHLDPDGELTDDADRARTRTFVVQPQDRRLMSKIRVLLTPSARAKLEALLLQWAAPGMNNPADPESPRGPVATADADALAAACERDNRTQGQRNHDAIEAMYDRLLADGGLGDSPALPCHLVVTASLTDLEQRSGVAVTATGTRLPVTDLVSLAADATPWLEVFANRSSAILHFGRGRRLASLAQRLALFGRDRGCTAPGCTVPFVRAQAHHLPDWQDGGLTNIEHLGGACGGHNRSVGRQPGEWETEIIADGPHAGRVGWRPTGSTGPWRVNHALVPEKILGPDWPEPPPTPESTVALPDCESSTPQRPDRRSPQYTSRCRQPHRLRQ